MGWVLSERGGLSAGAPVIADVVRAQRARFLGHVATLPPEAWSAPSRCSAWTTHQVVRHVADVAEIAAARLAGRASRFSTVAAFDPTRTPDSWLAGSEGEAPVATVERLRAATEDEDAGLARCVADRRDDHGVGPTGRDTHWSVVTTHILWDAWLHERDLAVLASYPDDELRLVTLYAVLMAGVPAASIGEPLDVVVALDRPVRLSFGDAGITATEGDGPGPRVEGSTLEVLDALLGRGPAVAQVLAGDAASVERLSWLRAFMAPGT